MVKTLRQFDEWQAKKHPRKVGRCNECGELKELRQLEPVPLCGACYMRIDRQDKKEADLLAPLRDAKKREKKIRSEMNKVLNVADALDGLIAIEDRAQLEQVAKQYLQPIIGASSGHGHEGFGRDRDPGGSPTIGHGPVTEGATDSTLATGGSELKPPSNNAWWSMTPEEKKHFSAERGRAARAKKRAEPESDQ